MIKSMTGYGRADKKVELRDYQIEIKSVNHKYLDITIKMPKNISHKEEEIKKLVKSKLHRGKIDILVTFTDNSVENKKITLNTDLAKIYINQLRELAQEEKIWSDIQVTDIAKFPDVLIVENNQDDEMLEQELQEVTMQALNQLIEMRRNEGNKIAEDLQKRIGEIKEKVENISNLSTGLIENYIVKLNARIKELAQDCEIDENRIAQEVVIYADKCSVEEEVTRLNSHISQFKELLKSDENVGKKLDFIIQEMNRETNTIGSKANSLEITNEVINIKTQLENIREQVQNIE
ncbi:MAG: YicC/YloC family endoribonuclease [Clostridia bacterium]